MKPDLLVIGAGVAGSAAALAAAQLGARVQVWDAGETPQAGTTYDLLLDSGFRLVGGPPRPSVHWCCTRFHGLQSGGLMQPEPGYVVDVGSLRAAAVAEAEARGVVFHWGHSVAWTGDGYAAEGLAWPAHGVILADGLGEIGPETLPAERVWWSQWQGPGTPVSSFLPRLGTPSGSGQTVLTVAEAGRWTSFGWHDDEAWRPDETAGWPAAASPERTLLARIRSPRQAGPTLCGPGWLRVGAAGGLVPRHGYGLAQVVALARVAGALAARWSLAAAAPEAWLEWGAITHIPSYSLRQQLPVRL